MSMRWMKLEGTTFCTLLLLFVIRTNKIKIVFSIYFLNYPCNKKYPGNKSSPIALKFKYDFFWNIWEYLALRTQQGASTWPRGWRARPLPHGPTVALLHLFLHPHTPSSHKHDYQFKPESKLILLPFSISLLKAPLTKLLGGIVPWYVTPPLVQLVFVLVLYSLQIYVA